MITIQRIISATLFILIFCQSSLSQEFRLGVDYDNRLVPKLEVDGKFQVRKHSNYTSTYYTIFQAGLDYEILKKISISGSVRYSLVLGNNVEESFDDIHEKRRYTADIKYKTKRYDNDLRISNRTRYQHSTTDSDVKKNYLRNKTGIDYEITKDLKPYIAVEPYILLNEFKMKRCRIYMGNVFSISKREFELCYILEGNIRNEGYSLNHIVGIFYNWKSTRSNPS